VSKVTAGTITADWLVAAAIKTASIGARVELNSNGLQAFDAAGNITTNLSADPTASGQFIAFGDGSHTLARVDASGAITGVDLYGNRVFVDGSDIMADVILRRPKGVVAYSKDLTDVAGIGPGSPKGYLEMSFVAEANRQYKVTCIADMESTSAAVNERYTYQLLDGGSSQPVLASTNIVKETVPAIQSVGTNTTCQLVYFGTFTPGLHRLLWTFHASVGTGTLRGADGPSFFLIEDMGPADLFINAGVINDGSGTVVNPITGDTLTYNKTWYGSWRSNGGFGDSTNVGQSDGGQYVGLVGFNSAQIQADLAGKTVLSCKFKFTYTAWTNNMGTAVFGTHVISSDPTPGNINFANLNSDRVRRSSWPEGATLTTELGTTIGTEFKTGASRGIVIGPPPSAAPDFIGFGGASVSQLIFTVS
jgi:hypothetical protein